MLSTVSSVKTIVYSTRVIGSDSKGVLEEESYLNVVVRDFEKLYAVSIAYLTKSLSEGLVLSSTTPINLLPQEREGV